MDEHCENIFSVMREMRQRLYQIATRTTDLLRIAQTEDVAFNQKLETDPNATPATRLHEYSDEMNWARQIFTEWTRRFAEHPDTMDEIKDGNDMLGLFVWVELARLWVLQHRSILLREYDVLSRDPLARADYSRFALCMTQHGMWQTVANAALWNVAIMSMSQTQWMSVSMIMTELLNEVPSCDEMAMTEFRRVHHLLMLRGGQFLVQTYDDKTLDDPKMRTPVGTEFAFNRLFAAFASIYGGAVQRRFHFFDELTASARIQRGGSDVASRVQHFFEKQLLPRLPEDTYDDIYDTSVREGYAFAGDDLWFRWAHPTRVHSRAACITDLRPHLRARFFSEDRLTPAIVAQRATTSHVARLFLLSAFDTSIKVKAPQIQWMNGIVIDSGDISGSIYALQADRAPLLVQTFSSYWVYCDGGAEIYACDNIYEAIGVWCISLRDNYDGRLYGQNMNGIIETIIGGGGNGASANINLTI